MLVEVRDWKTAPLFVVSANEGGFFGGALSGDASFGGSDDKVEKWIQLLAKSQRNEVNNM